MKNIFYVIYNYDINELPYMLCDSLDEVKEELKYSKRMIQYGMNKGLVFTKKDGTRYTVAKFNMKDLDKDGI